MGRESEFWGRICTQRPVQVRENKIWGRSRIWRIKTCFRGRDGHIKGSEDVDILEGVDGSQGRKWSRGVGLG